MKSLFLFSQESTVVQAGASNYKQNGQ